MVRLLFAKSIRRCGYDVGIDLFCRTVSCILAVETCRKRGEMYRDRNGYVLLARL